MSDTNMQPGAASVIVTGNAPLLNFRLFPEAGTIELTGFTPTADMWRTVTPSTTTWTVVQP